MMQPHTEREANVPLCDRTRQDRDRGLLDQYVARVISTIESHQGRVVAFDEEPNIVEGTIEYPRTVILESSAATEVDPR